MPDKNSLEIVLTLNDKLTSGLKKADAAIKGISKAAKDLGRDMERTGRTMTFVGGVISGAFYAALNNAKKRSLELQNQFDRLNRTFERFNDVVAVAVLPVFTKFVNILQNLLTAFLKLDPVLRDNYLRFAFIAGAVLTLSGSITVITGKILTLLSVVISPVTVVISLVSALLLLMYKFPDQTKKILTGFEKLFLSLKIGISELKIALFTTISDILNQLLKFSDVISKLPGPLGDLMRNFKGQIIDASNALRGLANKDLRDLRVMVDQLGKATVTGTGQAAEGFDKIKKKIDELIGGLTTVDQKNRVVLNAIETLAKRVYSSVLTVFKTIGDQIANVVVEQKKWAQVWDEIWKQMAKTIVKEVVNGALQLVINKLKEIFELQQKTQGAKKSGFGGLFGGVLGSAYGLVSGFFAEGGKVGLKGQRIPLPSFADGGMLRGQGQAIPVLAHAGEVIGTPARLAKAGIGSTSININIFGATMNTDRGITGTAEMLGLEIENALRRSRSF